MHAAEQGLSRDPCSALPGPSMVRTSGDSTPLLLINALFFPSVIMARISAGGLSLVTLGTLSISHLSFRAWVVLTLQVGVASLASVLKQGRVGPAKGEDEPVVFLMPPPREGDHTVCWVQRAIGCWKSSSVPTIALGERT